MRHLLGLSKKLLTPCYVLWQHPLTMTTATDRISPADFKKARLALGLGPVEMARQLGVSYPTVWKWETGERTIPPTMALTLEALKVRLKSRTVAKVRNRRAK